jgi:hypothetical protein
VSLPALLLAQTLVSLAPTVANTRLLSAAEPAARAESAAVGELPAPSPPIEYSNGYTLRADIHRYASYATLPLFALEYVAGEKLLTQGSAAPLWAEKAHRPVAILLEGVFLANTVTGVWNMIESRKDPEGKPRRTVHGLLMLLADAGFVYASTLAPSTAAIDARIAAGQRGGWTPHKRAAVASIGVATVGYALMYLWKD